MSLARVILRPHRFEAAGVAVVAALTFIVAGGLALRLLSFGIPAACLAQGAAPCVDRQRDLNAYFDFAGVSGTWGFVSVALVTLLPAVCGVFFGLALIGKELDQGTTTFAWSIGPSRRRWLLQRVVPIGLAIFVICLAVGAVADALEQLRAPGTDPNGSLAMLGTRGVVIGAEAVAYFGIALLIGAVIGRILPALLLTCVLVLAAFVGVTILTDAFLSTETVLTYGVDGGVPGRVVDFLIQSPEGDVMTWQQAYDRYGQEAMESSDGPSAAFRTVLRINPPEVYPFAVARMFVLYSALALIAVVVSFAVVERRRP
jgi:hypothetical protein